MDQQKYLACSDSLEELSFLIKEVKNPDGFGTLWLMVLGRTEIFTMDTWIVLSFFCLGIDWVVPPPSNCGK